MAILIKVRPQDLEPVPVVISVPKTSADIADVGDDAFVWFAETQGGKGLVARGTIQSITNSIGETRITVGDLVLGTRWLGNDQIGQFRDSDGHGPESSLAKKIYKYAHNRGVSLTDAETAFLNQHIGRL